eukprot:g32041.t1
MRCCSFSLRVASFVALEEAQDGRVIKGMGEGIKMVSNWKVVLIITYRAQMLHETVPESALDLTDVEEATSGAMDTEGCRALHIFLEQRPEPSPPTTTLLSLAALVFTLNNFSFNSSHFLQANFDKGPFEMSTFSLNRGFLTSIVDEARKRVRPISHTCALTPSLPSRNSNRVPFVLTYYPTSIHIQKIIRCHFRHLRRDATTRHIFPLPPLSAFCRDPGPHLLQPQHLPTALQHLL